MFNRELLQKILDVTHIRPHSYSYYLLAFTHVSADPIHNYEKLEFLGDAVIDKIIAQYLFEEKPTMSVGELSSTHSLITQGKTMTIASKMMGLRDLIIFGNTIKSKEAITDSILEDVFEAFIGAVYLDQGEIAVKQILKRTIIHLFLIDQLRNLQDYKTKLQNDYFFKNKHLKFRYDTYFSKERKEYKTEIYVNDVRKSIG
jgi:ribonuclease-3